MTKAAPAITWLLESDRLQYRKITGEDFSPLKEMLADTRVMSAWEHTFSDELIRQWIENQLSYYQQDGVGYFAAIAKGNGVFVGQMGLHRFDLEGQTAFEVCYMLNHQHWHKGYALEGVQALTKYAFSVMGLTAVYAQVKTDNTASIAVAETAGFQRQSVFAKNYNGKNMPHYLYVKVKQ